MGLDKKTSTNKKAAASTSDYKPEDSFFVASEDREDLEKIFVLIRNLTQVDVSSYKLTTVGRRIQRQMRLHKIETLKDFAAYLEATPDAVKSLLEDIFIHVTEFFRDADSFEVLKAQVFPKMIKNRISGVPLRVWVPGCSTGEEAYSVAISLLEYMSENNHQLPLQIFATDISELAVEKARSGLYTESEIESVPSAQLKRFFDKIKDGYKIKKSIRDICIFSRHDLTSNPPFAKMNLISCRNVLIYFDPTLQKQVMPIFHYSLNTGGFLWLGRSETPTGISRLFTLSDKVHKIFTKINVATPSGFRFPLSRPVDNLDAAKKTLSHIATELDSQKEVDRIGFVRYAPAGVVINSDLEIVQVRGHTAPFLELPSGHISNNLLKMIRPELLPGVRLTIQSAQKANAASRKEGFVYESDKGRKKINVEVIPINPMSPAKERQYVVFFEEPKSGKPKLPAPAKTKSSQQGSKTDVKGAYIAELLQELDSMREYQQSVAEGYEVTQEELTSSNEELQSTLEEFQSTNEELETAKEEMQATNEELATVNDELQRRNDDLAKSEERFRLLVDVVRDYAIFMLDPEGFVTSWNEGARRLKGYERSEIIGEHVSRFSVPEDVKRGRPQEELELARKTGRFEEEGWRMRKDGHRFWASVVITRICNNDGNLLGFAKVTQDLTERKQAEQRRLEEQRLADELENVKHNVNLLGEVFLQSHSFMALTIGPSHVFERANQKYYDFLCLSPAIIGKKVIEILPEIEAQGFINNLDGAFRSGEAFSATEAPLKLNNPDGTERLHYVDFVYQPIRNTKGEVYGLVHTGLDVTERVLTKQSLENSKTILEDALKARDEFLAVASHELKTPLTALKLQLQMGQRTLSIKQIQSDIKEDILGTYSMAIRQSNSLTDLVEELLEVSRIQVGTFRLDLVDLDFPEVIRETLSRFAEQLKSVNCSIEFFAEEKIAGSWDRHRLERVIINLLSNAIKYAPNCPIKIDLRRAGNMIRLTFQDGGPGIPKEKQVKIFNRFERAGAAKNVGGMGLGLYIVKRIIDAHKGKIAVESEQGHGTRFIIDLPSNLKAGAEDGSLI